MNAQTSHRAPHPRRPAPGARRPSPARAVTAPAVGILALLLTACPAVIPPEAVAPAPGALPPVPAVRGELEIDLVYPFAEDHTIAAVDSTYVFGSVGHGEAEVTVNGHPVHVAANGAWLGFTPVPRDGRYEIVARLGDQEARYVRQVQVAAPPTLDAEPGRVGVIEGSLRPTGVMTGTRGEGIPISVRATPGAEARLVLPDGTVVPLVERRAVERAEGFMLDRAVERAEVAEYVGTLTLERDLRFEAPDAAEDEVAAPTLKYPGGYVEPEAAAPLTGAYVEVMAPGDTLRLPFEASIAVIDPAETRVAVVDTERADSSAVGQVAPGAGQAWEYFWWQGTRVTVDGETDAFYRVRLTDDRSAWVNKAHLRLLPEGTPPARGDIGPSIGVEHEEEWVNLRFSTTERLPYRLLPDRDRVTVEFFGASGRPGYVSYGREGFVDRMHWEQPDDDLFLFHVELDEPLWGFRSRWEPDGRLLVQLRRPPRMDPANPLAGLTVVVDAGHGGWDTGAIGPTRYTEAEAVLDISKRLVDLLEARGATTVEPRPDTAFTPLGDRPIIAMENDGHILVSVHLNAFPDGVNPFENAGTMMFYYWPQSLDLARHLQREVVSSLGLRDLGVRFQNLALPRTWWMPSVLTEAAFMMIPEQEAAMRVPEVRQRLAEAHLRAIERFLQEVAHSR